MSLSPAAKAHRAALIPAVAGATSIALAIYLVALTPPSDGRQVFDTPSEFGREGLMLAWLAASITGVLVARNSGLAPKASALLIGAGYGLLFVGVAVGIALREDPTWFLALGAPGQLLSMAGFVWWAVWLQRHDAIGLPVVLLCGIGGLVAILGAEIGLTVLVGGFWIGLAVTRRPGATRNGR